MRIGELSIAVRERSLAELYDLSLLVCRRYWWQLSLLVIISYLPFLVINTLLLYHGDVWEDGALWYYLLIIAEFPLISAAATLFLGNALFHGNCGILYCLRQALDNLPALLTACILKVLVLLTPVHLVEITLLEQLRGKRARKRGMRLLSGWRQDYLAQLLLNTGLFFIVGLYFIILAQSIIDVIFYARQPIILDFEESIGRQMEIFDLRQSLAAHLVLIPTFIYLTVLRFLSYINLRTVREGWSTELQLKDAARRLFGAEA